MHANAALWQVEFYEADEALNTLSRGRRQNEQLRKSVRDILDGVSAIQNGSDDRGRELLREVRERYAIRSLTSLLYDLPPEMGRRSSYRLLQNVLLAVEQGRVEAVPGLLGRNAMEAPNWLARLGKELDEAISSGGARYAIIEAFAKLEQGRLKAALAVLDKLSHGKAKEAEWMLSVDGHLKPRCDYYTKVDKDTLVRPQDFYDTVRIGRGLDGFGAFPRPPRQAEGTIRVRAWSNKVALFLDGAPAELDSASEFSTRLEVGMHWVVALSPDGEGFLQECSYVEPGATAETQAVPGQMWRMPGSIGVRNGHVVTKIGHRLYSYGFPDEGSLLIPETTPTPARGLNYREAVRMAKEAGGDIMTYGDWLAILLRQTPKTLLGRLTGSIRSYLMGLEGAPRQVITQAMIDLPKQTGRPWREFVSPDTHTGGRPGFISLHSPKLELVIVEEDERVEDVRVRIVYALAPFQE